MDEKEFALKVDYEGGIFDALLGYGLKSSDLDDKSTELYRAVNALENIFSSLDFKGALGDVEIALEEAYESDEDYDED